jgi:ABC-type lipoprotein release transport system permease subunit
MNVRVRMVVLPAIVGAALAAAVASAAFASASSAPGASQRDGVPAAAPHRQAASTRTPLPEIFLSDWAATRLGGAREGDVVRIAASPTGPWQTVRVARVYRPELYPTDVGLRGVDVRLHLPELQALLGGGGNQVDSIVVRLRNPARAADVVARLNAAALGFRAYTSADLARRNSSTFEVVARFHRAISIVAILASSVFLVAIMTLRGEEMRRQVGVMRLVGISPATVAASVLVIATGCALAGSAVGIGLGYGMSAAINVYYRHAFDTNLVFSEIGPGLLVLVTALSVALGVAAGGFATWRLLRLPPLEQVGR